MPGSESVGSVFVDVVPRVDREALVRAAIEGELEVLRGVVRGVVREELLKLFSLPVISREAVEQLFGQSADDK